jgi:hypothetical protein
MDLMLACFRSILTSDPKRTEVRRGVVIKAIRTPTSPVPKENKIITANNLTAEEIIDAKSIFFVSKEAIIIERRSTLIVDVTIKIRVALTKIGLKLSNKVFLLIRITRPDATRPMDTIRNEDFV